MAWGRHAPHTVETERVGGEGRSVADTERLGVGPDIDDRPAHAWEVDEAESWEPVAPDTWGPPADAGSEAEAGPEAEATTGEAWTDAARGGRARAPTDADQGPPPEGPATGAGPAERRTREAERRPEPAPRDEAGERPQPPLARLALGLASLAAQRMRGGVPAGDGLVTGLGLMRQTVNGLVALGERLLAPASRAAGGVVKRAEALPVVGPPIYAGLRSRQWLAHSTAQARAKIAAAVESRLGESGREPGAPEPSREPGAAEPSRRPADAPEASREPADAPEASREPADAPEASREPADAPGARRAGTARRTGASTVDKSRPASRR